MEYRDLLKALSEKIGAEAPFEPDESGAVTLSVDEMQLTILGLDEIGTVVLSAPVAEPPPEDKIERLYKAALVANHNFQGTSGATLSINPETNEMTLCRALELVAVDGERFVEEVERFVNVLESWRRLVADFRGGAAEVEGEEGTSGLDAAISASGEEAMPEMPGLGGSGFLQV